MVRQTISEPYFRPKARLLPSVLKLPRGKTQGPIGNQENYRMGRVLCRYAAAQHNYTHDVSCAATVAALWCLQAL